MTRQDAPERMKIRIVTHGVDTFATYVRGDLFDALKAENERLRGALTKPLDDGWQAVMHTAIGRFKVAALSGGSATWNAVGSQAMAELLTELARYVDRARAINAALTATDAPTTTAD
jgi:hypothetical protein